MVAAQAAEVPAVTSQASMAFQAATAQAAARAAEQVAAASTAQAALAASGAAQIGSGGGSGGGIGSGGGGTTEAHVTLLGIGFLCPPPAPCARSSNTPAIILRDFKGNDCWCY